MLNTGPKIKVKRFSSQRLKRKGAKDAKKKQNLNYQLKKQINMMEIYKFYLILQF